MSRLARSVLALGAALVACVLSLPTSTIGQASVAVGEQGTGTNPYDYGAVMGSKVATFAITSHPTSSGGEVLESIVFANPQACIDFTLGQLPPPDTVLCAGDGSGSNVTVDCSQSVTFTVTFTPQSVPQQQCIVNVTSKTFASTTSVTVPLTLFGSGFAPPYRISASPATIQFGTVEALMPSNPQVITVTNTGTQQVVVTGTFAGAVTSYAGTPDPAIAAAIAPQTSKYYSITCTPQPGANAATLTFSTTSQQGALSNAVTLSCTGVTTSLAIVPNPIDVGSLLLGHAPVIQDVTITNNGTNSVELSNFALDAANPDVTLVATPPTTMLAIGETMMPKPQIRYAATTVQPRGTLGSFVFTVNATTTTDVSYPIVGGVLPGSIGTNPASVEFGSVCVGRSVMRPVAVFANAAGDVRLMSPTSPLAPFSVTSPTGVLGGHHAGEITLLAQVDPTVDTPLGDATSIVTLNTNVPGDSTYDLALRAFVAVDGPAPAELHFGTVDVDTLSTAFEVRYTNCGGAPVMVTGARIAGRDAGAFSIVSPTPSQIPMLLDDGDSEAFLVVMSPRAIGTLSAELVIETAIGSASVALAGIGARAVDRETYYACSSHRATSFGPIALALLWLGRRSRRRRARVGRCMRGDPAGPCGRMDP